MKKTNLGFLLSIAVLSETLLLFLLKIPFTEEILMLYLKTSWLFACIWLVSKLKEIYLVKEIAFDLQDHLIKKDSAYILSFAVIMSPFISVFHLGFDLSFEKIFLTSLISIVFSNLLLEVLRQKFNDLKNYAHKLIQLSKDSFVE